MLVTQFAIPNTFGGKVHYLTLIFSRALPVQQNTASKHNKKQNFVKTIRSLGGYCCAKKYRPVNMQGILKNILFSQL